MLAIYCRTSNSKSGKKDYSIETQQDGGIKLANTLEVDYKVYIDEGISGTIREREAFMQMMEHIQGKDKKIKITGVYCIDQSRIERDSDIWRFFSAECINNKVKFYPNGIELDLNDLTSKLFADLLSLVNEYYAALTSKKVKLANAKKTLAGKTHGQIAYGYGSDAQNNYIINEDEAEHVRKIFQWKLEGLGNYIIAKKLIESNVPTRQNTNWRGVTIDGIIKNKIYKGIREWNKDDIENYFEVKLDKYIIDPELWDKVNKVYKENMKNVGKKQQFNYLLDDILYCGKCGQKYFGKKRIQSTDSSYRCRGMVKFANHVCRDNRGVSIEKMDTFVIKHLFENKSLKELLINAPKNEGELSILRQNLADLTKKKDIETKIKNNFYKLLSNPELESDTQIIADYTKSKNKLIKLTDEINELSQKIAEVGNLKRNDLTKTLIESYTKDIDFGILKKLVNSLIERIEIDYDRKPSSHGGVFQFKIKYKNFEESSLFISKSTLFEYFWIGYNRTQSITPEDLEEDREMEKGILSIRFKINSEEDYLNYLKENSLELKDEENPWSKNFVGNEISTSMNEKIIFTKEELINVN